MINQKFLLKSKTVWVALLIAISTALEDNVKHWVAAHPGWAGSLVSILMIFLRLLTTGAVSWKRSQCSLLFSDSYLPDAHNQE